jgi:N-acetylglucosaminyldiphosphoundecaprenol N-acetyl-beta-D-mannosaminyltransferase
MTTLLHNTMPCEAATWPPKYNLFGVQVSGPTCEEARDAVMSAARLRKPAIVSAFAVHSLIEACASKALGNGVNQFSIVLPDGQPLRWALNWLHGLQLKSTVQGYELMLSLCRQAADEGVSIYLYGSTPQTLAALESRLQAEFPNLIITGAESPPFRPLSPEEDAAMVERINQSGAGLVFLGLGCPKQDWFAAEHMDRIQAIQLCVGAAFDFLAGNKSLAPAWMQRFGLQWVYRLYHEPRRLWKRYLVTNTIFLQKLTCQLIRQRLLRFQN